MENDNFGAGFTLGMGLMFVLTVCVFIAIDTPPGVVSEVRLQPEIQLTTDGKTIDTLYIYKQTK